MNVSTRTHTEYYNSFHRMRVLVGWLVVCHLGSVACILCLLFSQLLGMFNGNIMASCPSIGQQGCAAGLPPTQKYNKRIWLFDVSQWKYINLFPISANAGRPLPPEGDCPVFPYVDRKARINPAIERSYKKDIHRDFYVNRGAFPLKLAFWQSLCHILFIRVSRQASIKALYFYDWCG